MMNKCFFMGRMTNDVEIRTTTTGNSFCSFSIACDRDFKDKDGNRQTDFINCIAFRNTADFIAKNFPKGRMIVVIGRLQVSRYETKDGEKRSSVEIVVSEVYFADSKQSPGTQATKSGTTNNQSSAPKNPGEAEFVEIDDGDDLPFN